jgi:hypothetical protein
MNKKKTEGYANLYRQKKQEETNKSVHDNTTVGEAKKMGIIFDKLSNWGDLENQPGQEEMKNDKVAPIQEGNDEFSINTSNFTNRYDIGNNVDKIELSNIFSEQKKFNIDHFVPKQEAAKAYDVIDERDERYYQSDAEVRKNREGFEDSLDEKSGFTCKNIEHNDITNNQLDDIGKELVDIKKNVFHDNKNMGKGKKSPEKKEVKKRKQSPYLRNAKTNSGVSLGNQSNMNHMNSGMGNIKQMNMNSINGMNNPQYMNNPYDMKQFALNQYNSVPQAQQQLNNQPTNPISIQTYQHNTNIMHFPTNPINPLTQMNPMYYPIVNPMYMQPMYYPQNNSSLPTIYPRGSTPRGVANEIQQPVKAVYKPYSIKDYKDKYNIEKPIELKGLGANIGTKDWLEREKKKEKMSNYSKVVKKKAGEMPVAEVSKIQEKALINNLKPIGKIENVNTKKTQKKQKDYLNESDDLDDSMLYDILESKVDYKVIAKEYNAKISKQLNQEQKEREKLKEISPIAVVDDDISKITDDKSNFDTESKQNRSGYSHIHQIRKLKTDGKVQDSHPLSVATNNVTTSKVGNLRKVTQPISHTTSVKSDKFIRAKSSIKFDDSKSKIYTTLNHHPPVIKKEVSALDKIRALSSKPKKLETPIELDNLIQNHLFYKDKVENIRKFINKI